MAGLNVFVVSYDVMDQKRLQKVHKTMKGFGEPIHYSVFRCNLTPKGRVELKVALHRLLKHDEDRVMIIDLGPVDGRVSDKIEFIGVHPEEMKRTAIIV